MRQATLTMCLLLGALSVACSTEGDRTFDAGDTGTDGTDGGPGFTGGDGTDGTSSSDGSTSTDSTTGTDGTDGLTSTDGISGTDGTDSTTGGPGTDGTDSTDGGTGTDGTDSGGGAVGALCTGDTECNGDTCLPIPGGYCTVSGCDQAGCPSGSSCFEFTSGDTYCLKTCTSNSQCAAGQVCDSDGTCWPGETTGGSSPIGGACSQTSDCADPGATCYPYLFENEPTGFVNGYCIIFQCTEGSCPGGSVCQEVTSDGGTACVASCTDHADCRQSEGYSCFQPGICFPGCGGSSTCPTNTACDPEEQICLPACTEGSCPQGTVCKDNGTCGEPPCTATSCGAGLKCANNGVCVPDLEGGPGAGPGPACSDLPPRDCTGSVAYCGELMQFTPVNGTGYTNYPLNGETWENQYRSYARRDLQMLIKWATAYVDCKAASWGGGNGFPLGLGDMSEADGAIPGTSIGSPGHPPSTHEDGYDMDIAYYQNAGTDNYLKAVCDYYENEQNAYHCVSEPYLLDLWRTALFIGALLSSERTRVIGVDGKVGALVMEAIEVLCGDGWLPAETCNQSSYAVAFEVTDGGAGWYYHHHHHLHISLWGVAGKPGVQPEGMPCLTHDCSPVDPEDHAKLHGHGHGLHELVPLRLPLLLQQ